MEQTVKLASRIFSVSQSTLRLVLQKMTAWVMVILVVQIAQGFEFPFVPLDGHEELLDTFQRQFITFDQNTDRIRQKL